MTACPKCGASLGADFGMASCPSCEALLFIDMEGEAHISQAGPGEPAEFTAGSAFPPADASDKDEAGFSFGQDLEPLPERSPERPAESAIQFDIGPSDDLSPAREGSDFAVGPPEDPLSLGGFANSEASQAKDGPLVFKILISGIDAKEMRESIREALTDSRFGWDVGQIMAGLTKGQLTIDNLSPVKATVIVSRLKRMPISIRWEQNAVVQLEGP